MAIVWAEHTEYVRLEKSGHADDNIFVTHAVRIP